MYKDVSQTKRWMWIYHALSCVEKKHGLLGEIRENSYERKDAKIKAVSHQNVIHLLYFSSAVEIAK